MPDSKSPLAHFYHFPRLPAELRITIWQMAVCADDTPRLHYYSLFNTDSDHGDRKSLLQQMMRTYHPDPDRRVRLMDRHTWFYFPRCLRSRPSECSWTEANRFLYLWDAGLRTACRESRMVLHRHGNKSVAESTSAVKTKTWTVGRRFRPQSSIGTRAEIRKLNDVVVAHHHHGEQVHLRVCCKRDIVCLRFSPDDLEASVRLRWDVLIPRLPFYHLPHASDINMALEFHKSWDDDLGMTRDSIIKYLPEASERGIAMRIHWAWRLGRIPRRARLWLIDRSGGLPPNYQPTNEGDDRYDMYTPYDDFEVPWDDRHYHVFSDGKATYVENYKWENMDWSEAFWYSAYSEVPVLSFIWKLMKRCNPGPNDEDFAIRNDKPHDFERFFKVLRQAPDPNCTHSD